MSPETLITASDRGWNIFDLQSAFITLCNQKIQTLLSYMHKLLISLRDLPSLAVSMTVQRLQILLLDQTGDQFVSGKVSI